MRANKRKNRLFAFSSIVWQQAGPPDQTLRARWILPLSALERLENQKVICAFLPSQRQNPPRTIGSINGSVP
jgi:hypothetical protein